MNKYIFFKAQFDTLLITPWFANLSAATAIAFSGHPFSTPKLKLITSQPI
jgi:hypothetical protein